MATITIFINGNEVTGSEELIKSLLGFKSDNNNVSVRTNTNKKEISVPNNKKKTYKQAEKDVTIPYGKIQKIGKTYFIGFVDKVGKDVYTVIKNNLQKCMLINSGIEGIKPSDIVTGEWNKENKGFEFKTKKAAETFINTFKVVTAEERNKIREGWNK